jgi:hypothetical protein
LPSLCPRTIALDLVDPVVANTSANKVAIKAEE